MIIQFFTINGGNDKEGIDKFEEVSKKIYTKAFKPLSYFLGIEVARSDGEYLS